MRPISELHINMKKARVADLMAYMHRNGWVVKETRPYGTLFAGPLSDEGRPIVQLVPLSEDQDDFFYRVDDLIRSLSVLEHRPMEAILRDILAGGSDATHQPSPAHPEPPAKPTPRSRRA